MDVQRYRRLAGALLLAAGMAQAAAASPSESTLSARGFSLRMVSGPSPVAGESGSRLQLKSKPERLAANTRLQASSLSIGRAGARSKSCAPPDTLFRDGYEPNQP